MGHGHGGARSGAGRPKGGVSDARRLLLAGLQRALADAAAQAGLVEAGASEEERATVGIANIARGLIQAGRGDEVVKLYALSVTKIGAGEGEGSGKSPFLAALARLPGMVAGGENGTDPAQPTAGRQPLLIESAACEAEPADRKSDGPLFDGRAAGNPDPAKASTGLASTAAFGPHQVQGPADGDAGPRASGAAGSSLLPQWTLGLDGLPAVGRGPRAGRPAGRPPHPPGGPAPASDPEHAENLEFSPAGLPRPGTEAPVGAQAMAGRRSALGAGPVPVPGTDA